MRLFDPKFKTNYPYYLLQCLCATIVIFTVLLITNAITNMVVVASLGASTFIAFTMPHTHSSRPRYFLGGYVIGIICGIPFHYINVYLVSIGFNLFGYAPFILTCAIAVGLAMFLMTLCNFEHPPAAALAMGLVMESHVFMTAFVALFSILTISIIKAFLKKRLKNLL